MHHRGANGPPFKFRLFQPFLSQRCAPCPFSMADFGKLDHMVESALPFVSQWATLEVNRAQLEVCLAGTFTIAFRVASKYHWTLVTVLCSPAAKVLIPDEEAAQDLSPAGWVCDRPHPASLVTVVSAMPASQAHMLVFQLSAAVTIVTAWAASQSDLIRPEDRFLFRHLRVLLFDILTSVRAGAGGPAMQQLSEEIDRSANT